ncbi:uncharacterized protein LOC110894100 [Helianthus annuus]|uniref:uncharacterized protein LOC110894100 n=1 Tax=Helianthus annuus TaxID=4232 RepID=UPI000B8FA379|nr:uncharacterized protein LOC110894100 [Helianthus annuus]
MANTLYGYFLGDRVAYPVVDYFVKNNWKRFGLQKSMMNANGFFFFKFGDQAGMMNALNEGPWMIRSQPMFLEVWSPSVKLVKKEIKKVKVWVKIHEVPIAAYMEDGLSLIASAIGEPKALDSFTTSMCVDVWGRSSYARALVEISAENEFKEELVIAVPCLDGDGFVKEKAYVEYEWFPHRCGRCCVFGHNEDACPKQVTRVPMSGNKGVDSKKVARRTGFPVNKPKPKFEYRPVAPKVQVNPNVQPKPPNGVAVKNSFDALRYEKGESSKAGDDLGSDQEESDDEEVTEVYNETNEFIREDNHGTTTKKGASTPVSVVLNANYYVTRRELWQHLKMHKALVRNDPWVIMGDFNSALNLEDKSMGVSTISQGMREFKECVEEIEMFDVNRVGMHFTWNQKPKNGVGLLKKIDRVLGNNAFMTEYPESVAMFQPYGILDHCPCILKFPKVVNVKPRPFKFANFLVHKPKFLDIVKAEWDTSINGVYQFQVMKKLRMLKSPLRALLFAQGNLHKKVVDLREKLGSLQKAIDQDPTNEEACLDEEIFLKQKSKVEWLRAGDSNSAYFHMSLKSRNHRTRLDVITDANGTTYEGDKVPDVLVHYYENFLGCHGQVSLDPSPELFTEKLDAYRASHMIRPITLEEVKTAMFSIGNDKAPGPDGFTAAFF